MKWQWWKMSWLIINYITYMYLSRSTLFQLTYPSPQPKYNIHSQIRSAFPPTYSNPHIASDKRKPSSFPRAKNRASSVSPLSLYSHERPPRDQINRFWCGSGEVDVQFVRGPNVSSDTEGLTRVSRSSREGFHTQTPEERAWDRSGRVAMEAGWELLGSSCRTPGGHCQVSHVRMAPRVM